MAAVEGVRGSYGRRAAGWQFVQRSSAVSTVIRAFSVSCGKFWKRGLSELGTQEPLPPSQTTPVRGRDGRARRLRRRAVRGQRPDLARVLVALLADRVVVRLFG